MTFSAQKYRPEDRAERDNFIRLSDNGHFQFLSDFTDYHGDKFADNSLIIKNLSGKWKAFFPAEAEGEILHSHRGLSFGGLVFRPGVRQAEVFAVFEALLRAAEAQNFKEIVYKQLPDFWRKNPYPAENQALFSFGGRLLRREIGAVATLDGSFGGFSKLRRRRLAKTKNFALSWRENSRPDAFYNRILCPVLADRHGKKPVHSLAELQHLLHIFPKNIRLFEVLENGEVVGGVLLFIWRQTVHSQYIAFSERGKLIGASEFLFARLFAHFSEEKTFFSFGISSEAGGQKINRGLLQWKESFGAVACAHDTWVLPVGEAIRPK